MNALLRHPATIRVCQLATGLIFAWAGLAKVGDPRGFAEQVHNFRMVPLALENLIAVILPWIEIVAALALIAGVRARAGAVTATGMLVVFTVGVIAALARGLDIECGCFGTGDASRVGGLKVLQNLGMIIVAWAGTLRPR